MRRQPNCFDISIETTDEVIVFHTQRISADRIGEVVLRRFPEAQGFSYIEVSGHEERRRKFDSGLRARSGWGDDPITDAEAEAREYYFGNQLIEGKE